MSSTVVPAGLTGVTQVAAGLYNSLALTQDGTVVAWGVNDFGQGSVAPGLTGVTQVAAGDEHNLVLVASRAFVSFQHETRRVAEKAGVVDLAVSGTNLSAAEASVSYARTGGSATPDLDFALTPRTLQFPPGQTRWSVLLFKWPCQT